MYFPSQSSCASPEQSGMYYSFINIPLNVLSIFQEGPESQPETEGFNLEGSILIIPWSCLILLLSICKEVDCGARVLPSNIAISKNGKLAFFSSLLMDHM